jgi:alpha-1,3-glucan synthase
MYPDRVFSKPEFTALPPYLFSGADFALIPSRDEPFGLVAVEFGRKGALGVGSRLGGLGLMPGWWFPVESSATEHMLSQFQKTIKMALKSNQEERAILRARSAVQRFPVVEWRQRLEDFHRRSITISRSIAGDQAYYADLELPSSGGLYMNDNMSEFSVGGDWRNSTISAPGSPNLGGDDRHSMLSSPLASPVITPSSGGNGHFQQQQQQPMDQHHLSVADASRRISNRSSGESYYADDPDRRSAQGAHVPQLYYDQDRSPSADVNPAQHVKPSKFFLRGDGHSPNGNDIYEEDEVSDRFASGQSSDVGDLDRNAQAAQSYDNFLAAANRQIAKQSKGVRDPFIERRESMDSNAGLDSPSRPFTGHSRNSSFDSISSIMDEKGASSPLNKAIVDFTDSDGEVAQSFVQKLQSLSSDNSKGDLCIEKYLIKSEKAFFDDVKKSKMSSMASVKSSRDSFVQSRAPSVMDGYRPECKCFFRNARDEDDTEH